MIGDGARDRSTFAIAQLVHGDGTAAIVESHFGHVVSYEEQAAAARTFEILRRRRIGNVVGVESGPLIGDANFKALGVDVINDFHFFAGVVLIAVLDRVDEGFFHRHLDREYFRFRELDRLQGLLDLALELASRAEIAGNHEFASHEKLPLDTKMIRPIVLVNGKRSFARLPASSTYHLIVVPSQYRDGTGRDVKVTNQGSAKGELIVQTPNIKTFPGCFTTSSLAKPSLQEPTHYFEPSISECLESFLFCWMNGEQFVEFGDHKDFHDLFRDAAQHQFAAHLLHFTIQRDELAERSTG